MKTWAGSLYAVLLTLWAGSLWTVGWVPVVLFSRLPDVAAGNIATILFNILAYISLACGVVLVALRKFAVPQGQGRDWALWALVLMLMLTLIGHFGIGAIMEDLRQQAAPLSIRDSPLRARFGMLHGISSTLYLIQAMLALGLVARAGWRAGPR
jgi:hypothetical protein